MSDAGNIRLPETTGLTAIVAEGGGQRGIFTAGVLDGFLRQQFDPFHFAIGVSAGAQNLLSYWLGEFGYAKRVIEELTTQPGFFVPYRWLMTKSVIDLDNYFSQTINNPSFRLPLSRFDTLVCVKPLILVATDKHTGQPVYLQPSSATVMKCLKASSAVPLLYRSTVRIDGRELYDGGIADPVPVLKAHAMGATTIVVIRTAHDKSAESPWRLGIEQVLKKQTLNPRLAQLLTDHENSVDRAVRFIRNPPSNIRVLEIAPSAPLASQAFGSSSGALLEDYALGYQTGLASVTRIRTWLQSDTVKSRPTDAVSVDA